MKRKNPKKALALVLAVLAMACMLFTACGEGKKYDLVFKNELNEIIDNLYYCPSDSEEWNEPITADNAIKRGSSFSVDFEKLEGKSGDIFDIGVITSNERNYDLYDMVLRQGDVIVLKGNKDGATYTITHADGTSESHDAHIYDD